jgi:phage minor structural protein
MIKIFNPTDTVFKSNGEIVLKPIKAKVKKEDNDAYYLDLEAGIEYAEHLVEGNIIVANTPQGEQAFRVSNPSKTRTKVKVKAYHVFYDSKNYLIEDSYVVDKNCNDALDHLNSATEPQSPFTTISDIATVNSFRCVRNSLYEAISTILERWGGHLVRDNFTIGIKSTIGKDNGVTIQYKKNLKEIDCEENWDNVVTKLLPVGKDGLLLPEKYVTSETQYAIPYTKTVSFNQDLSKEDYTSDEDYNKALILDLRQQAQKYVDTNCVPQVNYTLKANIEKITDVGDTIHVIDSRLGLNLLTNIISFEYDCIQRKYTQIEFGNSKQTLTGFVSNIADTTKKVVGEQTASVQATLNDNVQTETNKIWSVLGDSYVIYEGDKILVVDKLPKETATNVIMINNGGISFSQTGINGTFNSAWTIDGTLNLKAINVINLEKDVMTRGLEADITSIKASAYTMIPLNLDKSVGSRLVTSDDGGILIGENVSKILVSGRMSMQVTSAGKRHLQIIKNTRASVNILAWNCISFTASSEDSVVLTPIIADVQPGDIIYLFYYTTDSTDEIKGDTYGSKTSLTVEVIQ